MDDAHPEAGLALRAAAVIVLATEALAYLAREARCDYLADSLWEQVSALEGAPGIRAPIPDPAAQLADHLVERDLEDRAFRTGKYGTEWWT